MTPLAATLPLPTRDPDARARLGWTLLALVLLWPLLVLAEFRPWALFDARNLEVMGVLPVRMDVGGQADLLAQIPNDIARLSRQVNIDEFEILHDAQQRRWRFQAVLLAYSQLYPDLPLNSEAPQ